ncbi:hypothetical protein DRO97_01280 [Archaeoglobales archaeon]|nr:MAG: hypothetical protein DRO97_01280 [Archaeoglobales archaeon]
MVDGKEYPITLEGGAKKVFISWDTNVTPKRRMYSCHVDLGGNNFFFAGEFYEDGHGGLVGIAFIDGIKYHIGLRGKAIGLYEVCVKETKN